MNNLWNWTSFQRKNNIKPLWNIISDRFRAPDSILWKKDLLFSCLRWQVKSVQICVVLIFVLWQGFFLVLTVSGSSSLMKRKFLTWCTELTSTNMPHIIYAAAGLNYWEGLNSNQKEILQVLSPKKSNREKYFTLALHLCTLSGYLLLETTKDTMH